MSERTSAGMKAAKRQGRHVGRPPKLTLDQLALARRLIDSDLETEGRGVGRSMRLMGPGVLGKGKTSRLCTGRKRVCGRRCPAVRPVALKTS